MPWELVVDSNGDPRETSILVVHAAMLPTGEVLLFGGSEHSFDRFQDFRGGIPFLKAQLFDVAQEKLLNINQSPDTDLFCCGHAFLGDGRLLAAGGTRDWPIAFYGNPPPTHAHAPPVFDQDPDDINPHEALGHWDGERASWVYQHWQRRWVRVRDMAFEPIAELPQHQEGGGRWYPTLITLPNGRVIAFAGHPSHEHRPHEHVNPEIYSAGKDSWEIHANQEIAFSYDYYPRGHLVRDGRIFFVSPVSGEGCGFYDPQDGSFEAVENLPQDKRDQGITERRFTTVLLPLLPQNGYEAHVLATGWEGEAIRIHAGTSGWIDAGSRDWDEDPKPARRNGCAVLLPTGQVALVGGVRDSDGDELNSGGVVQAEIYTPPINWSTGEFDADSFETWETDPGSESAQVVRNYHSIALLLADGRILTAGSNINANTGHPDDVAEKSLEIYSPWYVSESGRPEIDDAPSSISYGQTFTVHTSDAADIERAAILRLGSTTHAFDADQRYIGLEVLNRTDNSLTLMAPLDGSVASPGYYMLWIINQNGIPCRQAQFVKVGHQGLSISLNRSTISIHDVESMLEGGQTVIPDAVQVVLTGAVPNDYVGPEVILTLDNAAGDLASTLDVSFQITGVDFDIGQEHGDTAQRIVFSYSLRITSTDIFGTFDEFRNLHIHAESDTMAGNAAILLHKQPNPFMIDGAEFWLSTDLRVFKVVEGQQAPFQPFPVISEGFDPYVFLAETIDQFDVLSEEAGLHPFDTLSPDQEKSKLELSRSVQAGVGAPPRRVYNFAVARVRYRSLSTEAQNVRVFFRLFNTVGTALEFEPSITYRRAGDGAQASPLIGRDGKVILSIPYFGTPRIDTTVHSMSEQDDPINRRSLPATGGSESETYFGCVLDFNQAEPRLPLYPESDGPFDGELKSLQELTRGFHQCLVAEIHFGEDLIPSRATPSTSDKLAQRNIWIEEAPNPGVSAESRTAMATCELQKTRAQLTSSAGGAFDEVMFRWNNLPKKSKVTIYMPWEDAAAIVDAVADEHGAPALRQIDDHTIEFTLGDVSFLPIPRGEERTVPALISIELPEGITNGQHFQIDAHQYSDLGFPRNAPRKAIGSFQIDIPVRLSEEVLPGLIRRLSVLKHIVLSIPEDDRWYPIMVRLLEGLRERVRGLGVDPDSVEPSPDGTGKTDVVDQPDDSDDQDNLGCYTGKICKLAYNCFGDFEGLVVDDCAVEHPIACVHRGLEKVALMAWRDQITVTIYVRDRRFEANRLDVCLNHQCPWSGRRVIAEGLTQYKEYIVGFCSKEHRDRFETAIKAFDRILHAATADAGSGSDVLNQTCPWSGRPISHDALTSYRGHMVGFCSKEHRDRFARAIKIFDECLIGLEDFKKIREVVRKIVLHC